MNKILQSQMIFEYRFNKMNSNGDIIDCFNSDSFTIKNVPSFTEIMQLAEDGNYHDIELGIDFVDSVLDADPMLASIGSTHANDGVIKIVIPSKIRKSWNGLTERTIQQKLR